jgi:hypothetical protein
MGASEQSVSEWSAQAAAELWAARRADGGWAYQAGDPAGTEPTALAILALRTASPPDLEPEISRLAGRQRVDGFWSASDDHLEPSWTTPLAGLVMAGAGIADRAALAAEALLGEPVYTFSNTIFTTDVYNYDPSIPGWPWTSGDFSFVESTALAMIFLKRMGHGGSDRVRQAVEMLHARALPGGQWNYGEPGVLGGELFAAAAPTALALAALADERDATTDGALEWLGQQQGQITSLFSLGWAAIGLNLLGQLTDSWRDEVIARWSATPASRRSAMDTALCLLGLSEPASHPFNVSEVLG